MTSHIVLHPDLSFELMNVELATLGWVREPDTAVAPHVIPGEPLVAGWRHRENGASLSYTFNPVVLFRTLRLDGNDTAMRHLYGEIERRLPGLDESTLIELLQSDDEAQLLLGVLAARTLQAVGALDRLGELGRSAQGRVAAAARSAQDEILLHLVEVGTARLREEKRRHPERSVLFPRLGDAHLRRQTIRWLIHDFHEANQHIEEVLRSALVDEDWEVRASAMLAAVRLGATAVRTDVARMSLPPADSQGLDETDRSILYAAHKLALVHLEGKSIKDADTRNDDQASFQNHLWQCMTGRPVDRHDRVFLFINALTEPLEIADDDPLLNSEQS